MNGTLMKVGWARTFGLGALLISVRPLAAETMCEYYKKILPGFKCVQSSRNSTDSSTSSLAESTNLNAASVATEPTGLGIEALYSFLQKDASHNSTTFGIAKGFKRRGAGLSVGGGNSFYENDIVRRRFNTPKLTNFKPYEAPKGKVMNVNLAVGFAIWRPKPTVRLNLGLSLRYLKSTDTWGAGPSFLFTTPFLGFGTGIVRLKVASDLPRINFVSSLVRARLIFLDLEYNRLDSLDKFNLGPVHIFTASLKVRRVILTAAQRQSRYYFHSMVRQYHYAFQYLLSSRISFSYMHNFIPGAHTLGIQAYL